jgi:hypothetical protein
MHWSETCAMDERTRSVIAASEDDAEMSAVCAEFGISRPRGEVRPPALRASFSALRAGGIAFPSTIDGLPSQLRPTLGMYLTTGLMTALGRLTADQLPR